MVASASLVTDAQVQAAAAAAVRPLPL